MATTVIKNFIAKALFKKKGAIANNKAVEFSANALEQRLKNVGVDTSLITNEKELNQILGLVKKAEDQAFQQSINTMLGGSKFDRKGEVFDMTGKKINPSKGIMGGKEINEQTLNEGLMKTDNPFSDLVKTTEQGPKTLKQREAEILARMNKDNKEAVQRINNRKMVEEAVDNASPGFVSGDRKYNAQLVAEDLAEKRFGKDFYDLDQKQQTDIYGEALDGLDDTDKFAQGGRAGFKTGLGKGFLEFVSKQLKPRSKPKFDIEKFRKGPIDLKFLENIDKKDLAPFIRSRDTMGRGGYGIYDNFADMPAGLRAAELISTIKTKDGGINYKAAELFLGKKLKGNESADELIQILNRQEMRAEGGRIGLKDGMDRRTFLKIMGGLASVPILGKFLKPAKVASKAVKAAPVVSKSTPPAYFFELADKIKTLGRVTDGPQERLKIHTMPAKDGKSELMLTEDIGTGEMQIKKIGKEGDEMTTKVETMEYTPGSSQADETTQGIPADSYDEYTEFNSRIIKDEYNDPDIIDGIKVDEIIEEVKDQAPSIKKAGGGIARMLGE